MKTLILKFGATGDVVRTSTLLHVLNGEIHWLTSDMNSVVLQGAEEIDEIIEWKHRDLIYGRSYDLVINLEDQYEIAELLTQIEYCDLFGAYIDGASKLDYTHNSREWFDLSLISRFGKEKADQLKLENRNTYQDILFRCLGFTFNDHAYHIPEPAPSNLQGDIAIAPKSGAVWPMKNWAYFDRLIEMLEADGYRVNVLPMRDTLLEHFGDIRNHQLVVSGDSLPMHIAMGYGIRCVSIFICTSPWEIHDYGIQTKIVSPLLDKYFYQRGFVDEAIKSIAVADVYSAVVRAMQERKSGADRRPELKVIG